MTAKKGNKEYTIEEAQKQTYVKQGFDIYEDGELVEHGTGKTVSVKEFESLKEELEAAKEQNANLQKELAGLQKEKATKEAKEK